MLPKKKDHPKLKSGLHPRNRHRERYDFGLLTGSCPELAQFVNLNKYGDESIDFFNPEAVKMLNKALLKQYYSINAWNIPPGYLCPPIPGRADYIHHIADLLGSKNKGRIPAGNSVKCLDIGVGANCIYPIIGLKEYGWSFTGSDIDPDSIQCAAGIIESNSILKGKIDLRLQPNPELMFEGIIQKDEKFDITICNPPFHASYAEALEGTLRKLSNLKQKKTTKSLLNFGGQNAELWCEGGEAKFISNMVEQSRHYATSCLWFSTLVSRESNLRSIYDALRKAEAHEVKAIPMGQGNKISRIVAWTFLSPELQEKWIHARWNMAL